MVQHHGRASGSGGDGANDETLGIHGMLVFGGQATSGALTSPVYISHLPMFMEPHDFQVIVRVTGEAADRYSSLAAHFGLSEIFTFKPEPFSIDKLDPSGGQPALTSFRGTLFRGHFERGGSVIASHVSFDVEQVVCFSHFSPDAATQPRGQLQYLCFGEREAAFLAHLITAPPDFDQILVARLGSLNGVSDEGLRAGAVVPMPGRPDDVDARLREGEVFSGLVQASRTRTPGSIELTVAHVYYLETGDLAAAMLSMSPWRPPPAPPVRLLKLGSNRECKRS